MRSTEVSPPSADAAPALRGLRAAAWANVGLHVLGLALAAVAMRPGTPAAPLLERVAYLAARPLGWTAGWLVWIGCALALAALLALFARAYPSPAARAAAILAVLGAALDIACDVTYAAVLPARAAGEVARFVALERSLGLLSLTGANGLYSAAVLVATLSLPRAAVASRALGLVTFLGGLVLAGAGLTADPRHVAVGTAIAIVSFLGWTLAISSSPRPR
jgi:hypothetical protein